MAQRAMWHGYWRERLVLFQTLLVAIGMLLIGGWVIWPKPAPFVGAAKISSVRPGSIAYVSVRATFRDPAPPSLARWRTPILEEVPVILRHDPERGMLAFFQRDPGSGCAVPWQQAEKLFIDPCHGSAYTATGAYVRGPSQRDLDQFDVDVTPNGIIRVNVYDFRLGTNHR